MQFYVLGSNKLKPESSKTIFADGSADKSFRPDIDIELSHWVPNKTPEKYKYDTSTEICLNFAKNNETTDYDLAINNHLDVDGILCVFSLVNIDFALTHEKIIIEAAKMGDFWSYGSKEAQILFQGLTLYMNFLQNQETEMDVLSIYENCFKKVFELIEEKKLTGFDIDNGIKALSESIDLIESKQIVREVINERFVSYNIPKALSENNLEKCLKIPSFNQELSNKSLLLPQARNYHDLEKVQLVSVEGKSGYYYDLFYPGYIWAETPHLWRAPGLTLSNSTNLYYYGFESLHKSIEILNEKESNQGVWKIPEKLTPFSTIKGRNFPVILSFINDDAPVESSLSRAIVIEILSDLFL